MALVLEQLQFSVETKQLDLAAQKIRDLGEELTRLRKPLEDLDKPVGGSGGGLAGPNSPVGQKPQREVKTLEKLLEKLNNTYLDMGRGFSKGEASILNQARSLGAMKDQLILVEGALKNIKELNKDPFDSSLGGVRSITQEFDRLTQRANLAAQGIVLTTKQLGEYSRLAAEARSKTAGEGLTLGSPEGQARMNQLLKEAQNDYLKMASSVKQLTDAEQQRLAVAKEQERLQKAAASASAARMQEWAKGVGGKSPELSSMAAFYKEQEIAARKLTAAEDDLILREQKLAFVNKELAAGLTTASANALFKYQKDLEALGKSTDEITKRTTAFRAGLVEKQGHSPIKKIADDAAEARKQVDHLARALGPQITDIFVGLATGQSPLMVLLQQGGQLRDQFALAGVEASNMGESLRTAASYMITSVKDVAVAVGQLLAGAFTGTGKRVVEFSTAITGTDKAFAALSTRMPVLTAGITTIVGVMGGAFIASAVALGVAFFKVQKNLDDLTKTLILSGGSLGLTTDSAVSLAISMEDVGISSSKAMAAIQAMAKEGGFARSEIQMITQSSVEMQKYLGVAVEDTVKQFAKLKGEPVDALLEVAKTTGMIPPEIVATVMALKDQGKEAEAAALAMKAYSDATIEQVQRAKTEYTDFGRFMIELGSTIASFWDTIKGVVIKASPTQELENLRAEMQRNLDFSFTDVQKKYWSTQLESVNKQILRQQELNSAVEQERVANVKNAKVLEEARKIEIASMDTLEKLRRNKQIAEDRITKAKKDSDLSQVARNAIISASEKEILKINEDIAKENKKNNAESLSAAKKLEEQRKKDMNVFEDLMNKAEGANKSYNDSLEALDRRLKAGSISQQQYNEALGYLIRSQPGFIKQMQDLVKAFEDYDKAIQGVNTSIKDWNAQASAESQQLEFKRSLIGKTAEEQALLNIEAAKQAKLTKLQLDLEKELDKYRGTLTPEDFALKQQQLIAANAKLRQNAEDEASIAIAQKQHEEFKKVQDDISGIIADALFEGGKKGTDSLKNYLKTTFRNYVIRVFIEPIVGNLLSSLGIQGGTSGTTGTLSSAGSLLSGIQSAYSLFSGGITASLGSAVATAGSLLGSSFLTSISAGIKGSTLAAGLAGPTTAGASGAVGIGASIGAAAPWIAGALLLADAFELFDGGSGPTGSGGYYSSSGKAANIQNATAVTQGYASAARDLINRNNPEVTKSIVSLVDGIVANIGTQAKVLGISDNISLDAGFALDRESSYGYATIYKDGTKAGSVYNRNLSSDPKKAFEEYAVLLQEASAEALLSGYNVKKQGETASDALNRITTSLVVVNNAFEALGVSLLGTGINAGNTASKLIEAFGGVDSFTNSMSYFYENFYSEEEKFRNQSSSLTQAFKSLGLSVPETREEFRRLLEGALSSGDTGLSGKLIALMQPLNDFIAATEELTVSVASVREEYARLTEKIMTNEEIAQQRIDLEQRLFEATASQTEIAKKARSEIAGYNLKLYDQVILAEAAKKAEEARLEAAKKAEEARLEAEKLVADQRKSLQDEYFQLTATAAQLAAKERSEIDKSNLALYDRIIALKKSKEAEEARLEAERLVVEQRKSLQDRLFEATATEAQIAAKARSEISKLNLALYDQVIAAEKAKQAELDRLEARKLIADQRKSLEDQLFELTATATQLAAKERSEIDKSNLALYDRIVVLQKAKEAEEARAEAEKLVLEQRKSLQDRLFEATATEAQIAAKARSEIDKSNLKLYDQVIAAEKAKSAFAELQNALEKMTDSLMSEIDRLKGAIIGDAGVTGDVAGLSSEFAILSARAKTGESKAIEMLPEYSKAIESAVSASAVNASDLVYARAWLAASLGNTAGALTGVQDVTIPNSLLSSQTSTNASSVISSSTSSQSELIAALISEVQGLRAEVRADVSANTKTSKILERVNQDGETLSVTTV